MNDIVKTRIADAVTTTKDGQEIPVLNRVIIPTGYVRTSSGALRSTRVKGPSKRARAKLKRKEK